MRLRTFTARDMPSAMKQVREALGDDAIILSSTQDKRNGVTVTAAVEPRDELQVTSYEKEKEPPATRNSQLATDLRFQLQEILRFHNIPELFIAKILNADRSAWQADTRQCLEKLLAAFFTFNPLPLQGGGLGRGLQAEKLSHVNPLPDHPPERGRENVVMLIGPPGIGKTLTIARIAARIAMNKQPLLVITTDTKRAGGIEQLQAFTDILGIPLSVASSPTILQQRLKGSRAQVLIDTSGCNPYEAKELKELADFAAIEGIEPVLALPAGGDSLEAIDTVEAFMRLPVKRLMITRADTSRRFGGVLAAAAAHNLAFCNASRSASIAEPLLTMDAARLAQLLLNYKI